MYGFNSLEAVDRYWDIGWAGCCGAPSPSPDGLTYHSPGCMGFKYRQLENDREDGPEDWYAREFDKRPPLEPTTDYQGVQHCWILPDGTVYAGEHYQCHVGICDRLHVREEDVEHEWVKMTNGSYCMYDETVTQKQMDSMFDLAVANGSFEILNHRYEAQEFAHAMEEYCIEVI